MDCEMKMDANVQDKPMTDALSPTPRPTLRMQLGELRDGIHSEFMCDRFMEYDAGSDGFGTIAIDGDYAWEVGSEILARWDAADALQARIAALAEFTKWAITEGAFAGGDLSGGEIQDKAEELGLIICVSYDPEKHGPNDCDVESGDEWFVFTSLLDTQSVEAQS